MPVDWRRRRWEGCQRATVWSPVRLCAAARSATNSVYFIACDICKYGFAAFSRYFSTKFLNEGGTHRNRIENSREARNKTFKINDKYLYWIYYSAAPFVPFRPPYPPPPHTHCTGSSNWHTYRIEQKLEYATATEHKHTETNARRSYRRVQCRYIFAAFFFSFHGRPYNCRAHKKSGKVMCVCVLCTDECTPNV